MTFKYSYNDNEVYIISNEEIANLNQVELNQNFLSEYVYIATRHIECKSNENIGQVLYNEIKDHYDVNETIIEAKENSFQDAIIVIQPASFPYTKIEIFIHKLHKLKIVSDIKKIMNASRIN